MRTPRLAKIKVTPTDGEEFYADTLNEAVEKLDGREGTIERSTTGDVYVESELTVPSNVTIIGPVTVRAGATLTIN